MPRDGVQGFWDGLSNENREALLDAAVYGSGWYQLALDLNDGEKLDRRALGRLIDLALQD